MFAWPAWDAAQQICIKLKNYAHRLLLILQSVKAIVALHLTHTKHLLNHQKTESNKQQHQKKKNKRKKKNKLAQVVFAIRFVYLKRVAILHMYVMKGMYSFPKNGVYM